MVTVKAYEAYVGGFNRFISNKNGTKLCKGQNLKLLEQVFQLIAIWYQMEFF